MFLVNSRYPLLSATSFGSAREVLDRLEAHLLPKLRCQFAEFLNQGSLKRLGILYPPTCVGLRYGRPMSSNAGLFLEVKYQSIDLAPTGGASSYPLTVFIERLWPWASYSMRLRG